MELLIYITTGVIILGAVWYLYYYISNGDNFEESDNFRDNNNFKDESYNPYNDGPSSSKFNNNSRYSNNDKPSYSGYNDGPSKNNLNYNSTTSDDYHETSYVNSTILNEGHGRGRGMHDNNDSYMGYLVGAVFLIASIGAEFYEGDDYDDDYTGRTVYSSRYHSNGIRNSGSSFRGRSYGGGGK